MSPAMFWKITPRKFNALCKVHVDLNSPGKGTRNAKSTSASSGEGVGSPDSYIDQIL
jgi:hypothetical protein